MVPAGEGGRGGFVRGSGVGTGREGEKRGGECVQSEARRWDQAGGRCGCRRRRRSGGGGPGAWESGGRDNLHTRWRPRGGARRCT